jgi:hypothetical protein
VEKLLEFRNAFHNFRSFIKIPMEWKNQLVLVLARLKLIGKSGTRYIFLIFLEPRTD